MTPVRLEPAALRSQVKHSTTEPLHSLLKVTEINLRNTGKAMMCILVKYTVAKCGIMVNKMHIYRPRQKLCDFCTNCKMNMYLQSLF